MENQQEQVDQQIETFTERIQLEPSPAQTTPEKLIFCPNNSEAKLDSSA